MARFQNGLDRWRLRPTTTCPFKNPATMGLYRAGPVLLLAVLISSCQLVICESEVEETIGAEPETIELCTDKLPELREVFATTTDEPESVETTSVPLSDTIEYKGEKCSNIQKLQMFTIVSYFHRNRRYSFLRCCKETVEMWIPKVWVAFVGATQDKLQV